jgi:CheY-like chemotaxis protein|tara:strand:- start:28 stop:378 length:351 start_codon:yes stop_codon:yes gene_type:complete
VDDSLFQRRNVRRILKNEGHEILEASDGAEAMGIIDSDDPDFVVLDLLMPNVDGIGVLTSLSDRMSSPTVIVLTSDVQDSTKKQCLNLGASMVMNKPPDADELRQAVNGFTVGVAI